jgi:hypothetical protein
VSEELSEAELLGWRNLAASGDRGVHLDRVILRRLLATLDRATKRAEKAEAAAEAARDPKPIHHFAPRDEGGHNCIVCDEDSIWKCDAAAHTEVMPRWEHDKLVVEQGWNTDARCSNCGETNPHVEEIEDDLGFMLQTRKVLYDGLGKVLLACGNYTDCQERGGDYPLHKAMEDVMTASRETWVTFNRMMDARVAHPEAD